MASGLLSLKWNNHRSTFFHVLSSIRSKESYCDATLACDGRFYPVHKLVLSTCSEYFEQIFERTQCKHPVIVLKDIKYDDLEALMNYMYVGEVNVLQEKLAGLIKAAECLKIKGLAVPDEDPLSCKERRNQMRGDAGSPHAKRRRRDEPSSIYDDREKVTSRSLHSSQRDNEQISQLESHNESNQVEHSIVIDSKLADNHNQSVETESEQPDGDQNGHHIKQRSTTSGLGNQRPSSQKSSVPEMSIDETSVKAEPPDIQDEEVDIKDSLHSNLGYDPAGDGDSTSADPASVASGSNDAGFSDSNVMEATPQSVEDVVAQALPPTSSNFQGNSFSLWEGEGSLQNFPGEGFSGENSQGRPMVKIHKDASRVLRATKVVVKAKKVVKTRRKPLKRRYVNCEKLHKCEECGKTFRQLEIHLRTHTGERPYSCGLCPFRASQKGNLLAHVRRIHATRNPFPCQQCHASFRSNAFLKKHVTLHETAPK